MAAQDTILGGFKVRQLDDGTYVAYSLPLQLSQSVALPALNNVVIDSANVIPAGRGVKTAILNVTAPLTWVTGGQATIQAVSGLQSFAGAAGAASAFPGTTQCALVGSTANLGSAAATSLPIGIYVFSPQTLPELQWFHQYVGFELKFPSALTLGQAQLLLLSSSH